MLSFLETDAGKVALGGVIAFSSQIVVFLLGWVKEHLKTRSEESKEARFLAIRVVIALDEVVTACYGVVTDPTEMTSMGETISTVNIPELKLPHDGDYRSFPAMLMYEVVSMPSRLAAIREGASSAWDYSSRPEHEEYFLYREVEISKFGLSALDQIDKLCAEYEIPVVAKAEHYNPRKIFEKKLLLLNGNFSV